jgi:serine/threonine protein kinase
MPTEQLRGMPEFCSDIYALGMVTIQAVTGIHPAQLQLDDQDNPLWHHHIPTGVQILNNQKAYIATYTAEPDKFDKFGKQAEKIIESIRINI